MHLRNILGKPVLTTAETLIDVQEGKLTFRVNGEELTVNLMIVRILSYGMEKLLNLKRLMLYKSYVKMVIILKLLILMIITCLT